MDTKETFFNRYLPPATVPAEAAVLAAAYCLLFAGLFYSSFSYMVSIWKSDDYTYCYLIPFVALYVAWDRKSELAPGAAPSWFGLPALLTGIALYWLGELAGEYYTLFMASWLVVVGLCWLHFGWRTVRRLGFAFIILLTAFPLPNFLYVNLSVRLQLISSWLGVSILRLFGYSAYREGNIIDIAVCKFQVVDACNGLRYLIPLVVLGLVLVHFFRAAFWKRALLFLSTIPLAILLNGLRIGLTGIAADTWGPAVSQGLSHEVSGWIVFAVSLVLLLGEMWLLGGRKLFPRREGAQVSAPPAEDASRQDAPTGEEKETGRFPGLFHAAAAVLLLAGTLALSHGIDFHQETPIKRSFSEFPLHIGPWEGSRQSLESDLVKVMNISDYILANYRDGDSDINFYVAYYETQSKHKSIHTPATCLPGNGWVFTDAGTVSVPVPGYGDGSITVSRAQMHKNDMNQLVYYWFPQRGRILTNLYQLKLYAFWDALTRRRLDGALVRLITPVGKYESVEKAEERLRRFVRLVLPKLDEFIPGK